MMLRLPHRLPVRSLLASLAGLAFLAVPATANNLEPGSLLLFPEYDSRPGSLTFFTLTNTHQTQTVRIHMVYLDEKDCLESDASVLLTPRDTLTTTTIAHAPDRQRGFAFGYATSGGAISFNHVIGQAVVIDGVSGMMYSMNPAVFRSLQPEGQPTDINGNGLRDMDGIEYEPVPDKITIPRFVGQSYDDGWPFKSELILIGLSGGSRFDTFVSFLIFNDNEESFSSSHIFHCWERLPLLAVSGAFRNEWLKMATDHDPDEIVGFPDLESGWIQIDGNVATSNTTTIVDPAIFAVLLETGRLNCAALPFGTGSQTNGKLFARSNNGEF